MKFKIPTEGGEDTINMAPMIDLVFLLLIFFMAASHLTKLEHIPVPLPEADHAVVPKNTAGRQMVTLLADDDSGAEMTVFMNMEEMDLADFAAKLQGLAESSETTPIYLRVDRRLRHRHVRAVMKACAEAGFADVTFGAFESGK